MKTSIDTTACLLAARERLVVLRTAMLGLAANGLPQEGAACVGLVDDILETIRIGLETAKASQNASTPALNPQATGLGEHHAIAGLLVSGPGEDDAIH